MVSSGLFVCLLACWLVGLSQLGFLLHQLLPGFGNVLSVFLASTLEFIIDFFVK